MRNESMAAVGLQDVSEVVAGYLAQDDAFCLALVSRETCDRVLAMHSRWDAHPGFASWSRWAWASTAGFTRTSSVPLAFECLVARGVYPEVLEVQHLAVASLIKTRRWPRGYAGQVCCSALWAYALESGDLHSLKMVVQLHPLMARVPDEIRAHVIRGDSSVVVWAAGMATTGVVEAVLAEGRMDIARKAMEYSPGCAVLYVQAAMRMNLSWATCLKVANFARENCVCIDLSHTTNCSLRMVRAMRLLGVPYAHHSGEDLEWCCSDKVLLWVLSPRGGYIEQAQNRALDQVIYRIIHRDYELLSSSARRRLNTAATRTSRM